MVDFTLKRARGLPELSPSIVAFFIAGSSIAAGLLAVKPSVQILQRLVVWHTDLVPVFFLLAFILACAFSWVRYPERAPYIRVVLSGTSVLVGLNVLWLGYDYPVADQSVLGGVAPFLVVANVMVICAAVLSVLRPSFAILSSLVLVFQKQLAVSMSGGFTGANHYIVLADLAIFMTVTLILFESACALWRRIAPETALDAAHDAGFFEKFCLTVMCITLGLHFGNYFLSGYGKIMLDGGLLSWLLENKTHHLMLAGYNLGTAPLSLVDPAFGVAYKIVETAFVPFNIVVLFAQVFCFLAFASRRLMMVTIGFFDVMHVSIFLLTGALFFHWIVLNSLLLIAVSRMPPYFAPRFALVIGVAATLLGHSIFHTVQLAWYDTNLVRDGRFVAVYADGTEADVPPSFFRESSYMFYNRGLRLPRDPVAREAIIQETQELMDVVEPQVQTVAWGQTWNVEAMRRAETCALRPGDPAVADFDAQRARIMVTARHAWALNRLGAGRSLNYHLYPHDHYSLPVHFTKFESSDIRDVVAYYYKVESICLSWANGTLQRNVLTRTKTVPFDVSAGFEPARSH